MRRGDSGVTPAGYLRTLASVAPHVLPHPHVLLPPTRPHRFIPHVIEPSIGVDRLFLALVCSAYAEDEVDGEKRVLLKFHPSIAPIKVGIFPLVKNKPELMDKARAIHDKLKRRYNVFFDSSGAIGRRYRRMDEAGTPFCITVDFESLEDDSVTVRERDSTKQSRIKVADLLNFFDERIDGA